MRSRHIKALEKKALIEANRKPTPAETLAYGLKVMAEAAKNVATALEGFSAVASAVKEDSQNENGR